MTRRERLLLILENLGKDRVRWELQHLVQPRKLSLLSDEGIETLTIAVVREWRRSQKTNRDNRARRLAQARAS